MTIPTNEYMLMIRNLHDNTSSWPAERMLAFVKACEAHITELQRAGALIAAQPLARTGVVVAKRDGAFVEAPLVGTPEIQVGYYHVRAANLDAAIAIAKQNPELAYSDTARIEVRPVKTAEVETGFEYPR